MIRAILRTRYITAQGKVIREHPDGRVTIDAGGTEVTGKPISKEQGR